MKKNLLLFVIIILTLGCSQEPQTLEELRAAGQNAFIDGDYALAKTHLQKALHIKASDRDVLYYIGQTFQKLQQDDSAVYYFKRADILHPNDRELNLAIYQSAKKINDYQSTIEAIGALIHTGDNAQNYYYELADLNLRHGNIFVSFLYMRKLYDLKKEDPIIYLGLGNLAIQVDSVDFGISLMQEAIDKFGEKEEFVTNLAIYMAGVQRLDEAESVLKKYLRKHPNSQPLLLNLANILSLNDDKKKKEEALQMYKNIRQESGNIFNIDSVITALQKEL